MSASPKTAQTVAERILATDPLGRLIIVAVWSVSVFAIQSWPVIGLYAVMVVLVAALSGIRVSRLLGSSAPALIMLATVLAAGSLRFDGTGVQLVGAVTFSPEGFVLALKAVSKLLVMLLMSVWFVTTTTSGELLDTLQRLLRPLRPLRVPVDDIATMLSVAVRFIPITAEEFRRTALAQRSRAARVGEGGPLRRVVSYVPVLIPVVVGLFRRAESLARAMTVRCYGAMRRTSLVERRMSAGGIVATVLLSMVAVVLATLF